MYRSDFVLLANDTAHRSENVARRLPALEVYACGDAEAPLSCVADRLHFCSSPDFDDNAEVAYAFPCFSTKHHLPKVSGDGWSSRHRSAHTIEVQFTGSVAPSRDTWDSEP